MLNLCKNCKTETKNPKFCSKKCSITFNNKHIPKRKLKNKCKICKTLIKMNKTYCEKCWDDNPLNHMSDMTLETCINNSYKSASIYAFVRARAKQYAKKSGWKCCAKCGYNKYFEVCHIKPISSFSKDTLLSVINHPDNLIPLCPNCHWELDHLK